MATPQQSKDQQMADQHTLWNGTAGQSWIEAQDTLDAMFRPFEDLLVQVVAAQPRARVLDVGCGTGGTTIAFARQLAAEGQCVGIDISAPMLDRARLSAAREQLPVRFLQGDAQLHPFAPASFDLILSRFGVMFFNDPVIAFANLRHALHPGGELASIVWRSPVENPFMIAAERAVAPLLPSIPARDPDGPGQFAFADPSRVRRILEQSSWKHIDLRALDVECAFPEADLPRYLTRLGPLGRILRDADEPTKERALAVVRPAFDGFVQGDTVRFKAACWWVGARA